MGAHHLAGLSLGLAVALSTARADAERMPLAEQASFVSRSLVSQRTLNGPFARPMAHRDGDELRGSDFQLALSGGLAAFSAGLAMEGFVTLLSPCDYYDVSTPFTRSCFAEGSSRSVIRAVADPIARPGGAAAAVGTASAVAFGAWFTIALMHRFGHHWTKPLFQPSTLNMTKPLSLARRDQSIGLTFGFGTVGITGTF